MVATTRALLLLLLAAAVACADGHEGHGGGVHRRHDDHYDHDGEHAHQHAAEEEHGGDHGTRGRGHHDHNGHEDHEEDHEDHEHGEQHGKQHGEHHDHDHDDGAPHADSPTPALTTFAEDSRHRLLVMLPETVARRAVAGTLFVTVAGNAVIVLFLYFDVGPGALRVLVAFAVGGMLGDVFLHLLPHAAEGGGHDHHHHHHGGHEGHEGHAHTLADLTLGFSILAGIIFFFIVETGLRGWTGGGGHSHAHGHAHAAAAAAPVEVDPSVRVSRRSSKSTTRKRRSSTPAASRRNKKKRLSSEETTSNGLASALTGLKPAALLNLGADALHNFTDGLAIAVACQRGSAMAVSTILAVAVHELPHEIGDFAVLVQQGGFTKRGAFMAQWVSALGAFAGCAVGLEYGKESPLFVLGFTAGGFLYISLVNIMPDMLSRRPSVGEAAAQVVFMGLGIGMMVFVALYCE